ncbi:GNAT family N-acetyltransferase [Sutcliffiella cohnii]|uniref:GNAT family N-acetyltransferase n=1 Tax=Sutcliffiella cohnii TaxID=33932 RepID=A0A223KW81_9BACI|nr:GNAT family N-acetyltransferase [Sutcliffiella cohnii]AST93700.1 GNAT family N-acetyltransferase [Sutcliffiella cohnii]
MKSIKLRQIAMDDFPDVHKWSKDATFCKANGWQLNQEDKELFQWWSNCVQNTSDTFLRMGIEYEAKLIGYVDVACIKENSAELGIAIGDSTLWGKGLGYRAALLMIKFASEKLGITMFDAETHEGNVRSRKMLEKLRFKEISRTGKEVYLGEESQLIQYQLTL